MIADNNIEKMLKINITLLQDLNKSITYKEVFTLNEIGVDISFPSYFDFTKPPYVMSFRSNYVDSKDSVEIEIAKLNIYVSEFLDQLARKYKSLESISQHFQII